MKVEGPRAAEATAVRRTARANPAAGGFSVERFTQAAAPQTVSAPVSIGAVDALLALQAVPDALTARAKAARRGQSMLDALDELRDGFLSGSVSRASALRLQGLLDAETGDFVEPGLQQVLDEIALRAHVELAKLGLAGGPGIVPAAQARP